MVTGGTLREEIKIPKASLKLGWGGELLLFNLTVKGRSTK